MAHPKLTLFAARLLQDDRSASTSVYCGKVRHGAAVLFTVLILIVCVAASKLSFGQWMGKQTGCYADSIAANPNRPTVSNPAHVTQYGVLELEYGWDWLWPEDVIRENSFGGLLKFGMLCDIELRWNTTSFLSQTDATGTHSTFGDNWLGTEIRFHRQTARLPTNGI